MDLPVFGASEHNISHLETRIESLKKLVDIMNANHTAFDSEDIDFTCNLITNLEKTLYDAQESLASRKNMYETTVVTMRRALELRRTLLESADTATNVLQINEELFEKMVERQTQLELVLRDLTIKACAEHTQKDC